LPADPNCKYFNYKNNSRIQRQWYGICLECVPQRQRFYESLKGQWKAEHGCEESEGFAAVTCQ
jgi:hypothetical protein